MSLFSKILSKLGLKKPEAEAAPTTQEKKVPQPAPSGRPAQPSKPAAYTPPPQTPRPVQSTKPAYTPPSQTPRPAAVPVAAAPPPMAMVDVISKLETMARGTNLDWKVSIVDLLKVLDIDSSLEARKELATELGCPADVMKDNVKMNVWLHKTVLAKIAENGGNIPQTLLD
jgi:hypothetical protein